MKFLLALVFVAAAVAEPQFYNTYGSGLYRPYSGLYNAGYTYGSYVRPSIYGGNGFRTYGYGKREAEAEPEAEPEAQYYGSGYGYGGYSGLYKPYSSLYNAGYSYGGYVRPSIYGMGYRTYGYGKREAEAEPEAQYYGGYGYGGYSGLYKPYNAGYSYGGYVRPSIYGMGYRTYGYGKREAEAEPEAQYYGGYGYSGLYKPYSGIYKPYSGIYNTGYNYGSYMKPSIYGAGYYY